MSKPVRVRMAPSPTGHLHLGTARTALYNYLFAKHHSGTFVMRLEDTDEVRSHDAYTKDIIDGLHWLGLTWDEGPDVGGPYAPYKQSEKIDHYSSVANQLIASGHAYFCYCSPEELEVLKEDQKASGKAIRYDNRCRNLSAQIKDKFAAEGRVPAIRFRVEEPKVVSWNDGIKGEISIDSADIGGDMVIVKSNGIAIYNFAVVIDDIDMKISHVIRGEDHIHNTAKQLLVYEALGQTPPHFAHLALIFDTEHRKLSKRHHGEAVHVARYRQEGYMPEAMVNYLAQMSWTPSDGVEKFTLAEAAPKFELSKVSKSPAIYDVPKLNWFNGLYIRDLPLALIKERAMPFLAGYNLKQYTDKQLDEILLSVRDGLTTLNEIKAASKFYFDDSVDMPAGLIVSAFGEGKDREVSAKVLQTVLDNLHIFPWGDHAACKAQLDALGKSISTSGKKLYWPVRLAISGNVKGPDMGAIISILGEERMRKRLQSALQCCGEKEAV